MLETSSRLAALLLVGFSLGAPALADVVVLQDGQRIEGGVVGEDEGALVVLTSDGERRLDRSSVASVESSALPASLERKVERAREQLASSRRREAQKLIKRWLRAEPSERAAIESRLDALGAAAVAGPLEDVLDDGSPGLRDFALTRLAALGAPGSDPLLRFALVGREAGLRDRAHQAALAIDPLRARQVYEQVANLETRPIRRVRAIQRLGEMGARESAPALVAVLEWVQQEIKVQNARAGQMGRVTVNLGSQTGAALNAPIDLPQMELVEIATTISVPVLRVMSAEAARSLRSISGGDHGGEDGAAWKRWLNAAPRAPGQ